MAEHWHHTCVNLIYIGIYRFLESDCMFKKERITMDKKQCHSLIVGAMLVTMGVLASKFVTSAQLRDNPCCKTRKDCVVEISSESDCFVKADFLKMEFRFSETTAELSSVHEKINNHKKILIELLKELGVDEKEIENNSDTHAYNKNTYAEKKADLPYQMRGSIKVKTSKINLLSKVRKEIEKLYEKNILIDMSYKYLCLDTIKIEEKLMAENIAKAKERAKTYAKHLGYEVDDIKSFEPHVITFAPKDRKNKKMQGDDWKHKKYIEKTAILKANYVFYLKEKTGE